ncbi:hypothetical protein ABZ442_32925 [Streptomyces triculaminicus]|uniref:hypothetical protein n=1 Tax=Streptomyces triculaminicus TaxID=2816232 RepID=UPI0033E5BFE9
MIKRIAAAAALAGAALSVSPADAVAAPTPVEPPPSSHAGRLHVTAPAKGMPAKGAPAKHGRGKHGKRGPAKSQAPMGAPEMPDTTPPQDQSLHPGVLKGLGKLRQLNQLRQVGAATKALPL